MKYVCSWSGGKDSTASIILAHLHNEPLDLILMAEVMYDNERNISGENPEHIKWVREYAKPLFESWGYKVEIVRSEYDYLYVFNKIIKRARKNKDHEGLSYGFMISGLCSVKRELKMKPIIRAKSKIGESIDYVGIAVDEPKRLESLKNNKEAISLLEKYNYTEEMARDLCIEYGLLSPSYKYTKRNGCWFCPNAKIAEHKAFRQEFPNVWKEFVSLESRTDIANKKWNVFGETLAERDENIRFEEAQMTIFDFID